MGTPWAKGNPLKKGNKAPARAQAQAAAPAAAPAPAAVAAPPAENSTNQEQKQEHKQLAPPQRSQIQHASNEAFKDELKEEIIAYQDQYKQYFAPTNLAVRQGFNVKGTEHNVSVNCYPVTQFPTKNVYQYDILVNTGTEKRIVHEKVWNSQIRKNYTGSQFIYDGNRLAWSLNSKPGEKVLNIDLDLEEGRPTSSGKNNFRLVIRQTKTVNLAVVA
ncbi:3-ketoacyl-CoA thiolase with broad chain length specificity, partial [Ascosphaera pollenicola]